jgi:hypothetical protein
MIPKPCLLRRIFCFCQAHADLRVAQREIFQLKERCQLAEEKNAEAKRESIVQVGF